MKKYLGLIVFVGFLLASCAENHNGIAAKRKGSGCNTRAGMARKSAFNSIQYR